MLTTEEQYHLTLSKISHEIRNPVSILNSYLQLTQKRYPQVKNFSTWTPIRENMDFLIALLSDLSAYNNARVLHPVCTDLSVLLSSISADFQQTVPDIPIDFSIQNLVPVLCIDPEKLKSAIFNLLRNSAEALHNTTSGGWIHMILSAQPETVSITIENNGPLIPAEHLETLFDPFVTHKPDGTGLGLALVKETVEAHNGHILVSSDEHTTQFSILLPIIST